MAAVESQKKKEVIAEARNEGKTVGVVDGHLSSQEFGVGAAVFRHTKVELYSEATL